jgi:hypothetical protein
MLSSSVILLLSLVNHVRRWPGYLMRLAPAENFLTGTLPALTPPNGTPSPLQVLDLAGNGEAITNVCADFHSVTFGARKKA